MDLIGAPVVFVEGLELNKCLSVPSGCIVSVFLRAPDRYLHCLNLSGYDMILECRKRVKIDSYCWGYMPEVEFRRKLVTAR